jgi:hypothetical protein
VDRDTGSDASAAPPPGLLGGHRRALGPEFGSTLNAFGANLDRQDALLGAPVLDKGERPERNGQGVEERVCRQQEVGEDRKRGQRDERESVGREEGEVKGDGGAVLYTGTVNERQKRLELRL